MDKVHCCDRLKFLFQKEHVESCVETELQAIMDRKAGYDEQRVFFYLIQLGKCCVSHKPKDRPDMEVVLKQLESITAKRDMAIKALGKYCIPVAFFLFHAFVKLIFWMRR